MGTTCVRTAGTTGDTLSIQSEVVSLGRTLGFTRIEMRDSKERLVAFGRASCRLSSLSLPDKPRLTSVLHLYRSYQVRGQEWESRGELHLKDGLDREY